MVNTPYNGGAGRVIVVAPRVSADPVLRRAAGLAAARHTRFDEVDQHIVAQGLWCGEKCLPAVEASHLLNKVP